MYLSKSAGPDGIHGVMIDHLGPQEMQRLLDLSNLFSRLVRLPREWRSAIIIPILKTGNDASSPESFRPTSLISFVCKLIERFIHVRLQCMYFNDLLPREQHGFRRGCSAFDQILFFCKSVRNTQNMKYTNHTSATFLDKSKACDRVWHQFLIIKLLDFFSIKGRVLPWISNFLRNRSIRVKYNNALSDPFGFNQDGSKARCLVLSYYLYMFLGLREILPNFLKWEYLLMALLYGTLALTLLQWILTSVVL
ncbi:putative RNA-directed DNA polymerase from transposon BS [Trichonephila clavata]|uniref:Putative RNA-directed DNA polymerase from transposon BS n=1 Tax=Trichonephila clavata TaxID=2740835 RepID=A0A8X6FSW4_TRICU|nr:putative RNA-directed DNA polymerase from transposon BS [Trichonephila clavata]